MKSAQRENLFLMLRELVAVKKTSLIEQTRLEFKKIGSITERARREARQRVIVSLKSYIADDVMPKLNLIDGGELTELQEEQIDKDILNVDLNLQITPPMTPVKRQEPPPKEEFKKPEPTKVEEPEQSVVKQDLPGAFLKMKLMEFIKEPE